MNILGSWICIDSKEDSSYFPSSKGLSSDMKVQSIYWQCLACCMYTARYYNPNLRLVIFSNRDIDVTIKGVDLKELFKKLNVEFHITPFNYQTPKNYYGNWRNQFYEFSIFEYISKSDLFDCDEKFCLIDSDCIITSSLDNMFNELNSSRFINYLLDYSKSHIINGISRNDMKSIFQSLENRVIDKIPEYYAGEFFATNISGVKEVYTTFLDTWKKLLIFYENDRMVLNEEAHVLSYIFFKLKHENSLGNKYVKRLWTDPTTFRNVDKGDEKLSIWHLPAEKRYGFKEMFKYLSSKSFLLNDENDQDLLIVLKRIFSIPEISSSRKLFYFIKKTVKKIIR